MPACASGRANRAGSVAPCGPPRMGVFTPNTIAGTCSSGPLASSRRRRDSPSQREQPHRRPPPVEQAPEGAKTGHPRPDRRHPAIPPVLQLTFSRQASSPLARVAPRELFGALPTRLGSPQFDAERTLSFAVLLRSITRPVKLRSIDRNSVSPCDAETRHPSQPYEIRKQLTWHNGC